MLWVHSKRCVHEGRKISPISQNQHFWCKLGKKITRWNQCGKGFRQTYQLEVKTYVSTKSTKKNVPTPLRRVFFGGVQLTAPKKKSQEIQRSAVDLVDLLVFWAAIFSRPVLMDEDPVFKWPVEIRLPATSSKMGSTRYDLQLDGM